MRDVVTLFSLFQSFPAIEVVFVLRPLHIVLHLTAALSPAAIVSCVHIEWIEVNDSHTMKMVCQLIDSLISCLQTI